MILMPLLSTPRAGTNCLINYLYKLSYSLQETTNVFVDSYNMQDWRKIEKVEYDVNKNKFLVGCELFSSNPFHEGIITKLVKNIKDSGFINEIDLDLSFSSKGAINVLGTHKIIFFFLYNVLDCLLN